MLVDGPITATMKDDGGDDLSPLLETLHVHVKEQRFHLRNLDIAISETQNKLLLVDKPDGDSGVGGASHDDDHCAGDEKVAGLSPSKDSFRDGLADALDQQRWTTRQLLEQQRRERLAELQESLDHSLNHRGELLLELKSSEVELELLLLRQHLSECRDAAGKSMLLPRCARCFHEKSNGAGPQPSLVGDHTRRRDCLIVPDIMLIPAPLAFAKMLERKDDETAVRVYNRPGREQQIRDAASMHRSPLKGLVKMLKHRKSSVSRLATVH